MPQIRYNAPFNVPINGKMVKSMKKRLTADDIRDLVNAPPESKVLVVPMTEDPAVPLEGSKDVNMLRLLADWRAIIVEIPKDAKKRKKPQR